MAFVGHNRQEIHGFFDAAVANGGRKRLAPAIRREYHPGYYAAFVYDPNGNNIEAVFHDDR